MSAGRRCWPRRLPSPSRSPPLPWLPAAGPPAGHAVLGRSGHPDRVGVHMVEPAHADAATVHGHAAGAAVPGVQVERHRVIGPREDSRPAMRPGSSASGSRERGHQPPSTAPVPAIVGSSCSRSPGGAGGRVERSGGEGCWWLAGHVVGSVLGSALRRRAGLAAVRRLVLVSAAGWVGQRDRGTGVGAPGRLADGWVWWPGWLVGPLSQ
jgi:hypothetical protein